MRAGAELKHDRSEVQMLDCVPRGLALVGDFLQRRADEYAQALIGCANEARA